MFKIFGQSMIAISEASNFFLRDQKLYFKKLSTDDDFKVLQDMFETADGIKLPIDYLKKGRAFVCCNERLEPQGGFALIDQGPLRTLEQIPAPAVKHVDMNITEITAVCLLSGQSLRRIRYWSYMIGMSLDGPADLLVYSVDLQKTLLRERLFNHIRFHTLYEGPVKKLPGMSEPALEAVELTSKTHLAKGFLKLVLMEAKK